MDRALYVAMSGAKQTMLVQTANTHNLANLGTTGFRADLESLRAMPLFGPGLPTRVYAMAERPVVELAEGVVQSTGRDLDMAIKGQGWFAVQAPDGTEAYTRAGDLRIGAGGVLLNGEGYPVLGNGGPIVVPPAEKIELGVDGTISINPVGQKGNALAVLDRIKLVKPDPLQLVKGDDGLMRIKGGGDSEPDASVTLVPGALESSNVNPVEALVKQITLSRQFEMQVKVMKAADDNDQVSTQMMRLG